MSTMSLAELISQRREKLGISIREVARRSGGLVSHATIAEILRGDERRVSDSTLQGIAVGLDLSIATVRRAAGTPARQRPFHLPERAQRLNQRERRLVLNLVDTLLEAHDRP